MRRHDTVGKTSLFDFSEGFPYGPTSRTTYILFSKEELGALIGVLMGEIVNYEKRFQEIYYEQAEKLAEALNIDVELLLDDYTRFVSPGFGQRIKEIRASLGFTQQKYAELLGVGRCLISIWEIELHRPSRKNYLKILESKAGSERSV